MEQSLTCDTYVHQLAAETYRAAPFPAGAGCEDPIFPYEGVVEAFERLRRVYEVAGVPERCRLYVGDGGHRYYKADVWPFVRQAFAEM